ncbi:uncharacterized protein LOC143882793 [Tasmannia lanceolata]|uniref:uncharacterized protein LOC143882793 n=1 Tax=Tasmannia lanceolata TaxID=3420 RepID=UPI0040630B14
MASVLFQDLDFKNIVFARPVSSPPGEEEDQECVISNIKNGMEHLPCFAVLDYQNGLLLYFQRTTEIYCVCNPLTNKWLALPPAPPIKPNFHPHSYPVLAFDPHISPHYKVIFFLLSENYSTIYGFQIFSSETGNWVRPKLFKQPCASNSLSYLSYFSTAVLLNGIVNLLSLNHVIAFDVEEESFQEIQLLKVVNKSFPAKLGVSGGFLHYSIHSDDDQLRIWVFNNYHNSAGEWILKQCIGVKSLTGWDGNVVKMRAVAFHPDFDIVFLEIFTTVYSYNLQQDEITRASHL